MIQLDQLTKKFDDGHLAVDRLSLQVTSGEVFGLLGPNGAGKTTTLRIVLGLLAPTSGSAMIDGRSAADDPLHIKRLIGLVSASAGLYQWLTPREVLDYFATGYGMTREATTDRIEQLTDIMRMRSFIDQRCATLSTGQKQRVTLARALIHDPPVVLLDEPTRGLDVVGAKVVFDYVDHLRGDNKAVVVCTHRLDDAERVCDRFGLLHFGRLRHEGTLKELREKTGKPALVDMFLSLLDEEKAA